MPTAMKVLAVIPDGNVMDRLRIYSQWNPDLQWDIVTIRPDAMMEPDDWVNSVRHLEIDDRRVSDYQPEAFPDIECCQYEQACHALRDDFLTQWFVYDPEAVSRGVDLLRQKLMSLLPADVIVTWGERGWYNEVSLGFAKEIGIPTCRLERATFPGMLIADGTGLEQGRTDLGQIHAAMNNNTLPYEQLLTWLSTAVWGSVEQQERTTRGTVDRLLDDRETVFVPLQVPFDTNLVFRSNGFGNQQLLEWVAEHKPRSRCLVKCHPGDIFSDADRVAAFCFDHGWELVRYGSHALIEAADTVVSINSQCIIEGWMHGKSPIILGNPAFDLPDEHDKEALLYTLRFAYYLEPWQLHDRLRRIAEKCF